MGRNYSPEILAQLRYGKGQTLTGDTALVILKALLESGVSYLGRDPGSPTTSLYGRPHQAEKKVHDVWDRMLRQSSDELLVYVSAPAVSQLVSIQPATKPATH